MTTAYPEMTTAYPEFKNPSIENISLDFLSELINATKYLAKKEITSSTDTVSDDFENQEVEILSTQSNKQDTFVRDTYIFEENLFLDNSVQAIPKDRFKIKLKLTNIGKGNISTNQELLIDS